MIASSTVILSTSSMTWRLKNDSIARYDPTSTTIARPGGRIRNQTTTARAAIEEADARRRPTPRRSARRRATDGRLGLRGVAEVESRIVEVAGPQGGQSLARRRRWPCRAPPPGRCRAGEPLLAGLELERACRPIVVEAGGTAHGGRSPRRALGARPPGRPPRRRPLPASAVSSAIRASRTGIACDGGATLPRPGEPERVVPRLADRARPGVLRARRGSLAGEPVARVEAPQAAIAIDPAVLVARRGSASTRRRRRVRRPMPSPRA